MHTIKLTTEQLELVWELIQNDEYACDHMVIRSDQDAKDKADRLAQLKELSKATNV